jgi:hypothetical protein
VPTLSPPTKWEVRWRAVGYLVTGSIGLFVMLSIPSTSGVRSVLGFWIALVWSAFMSTAGVAAYATLNGKYRVEYVVLPLFGVALLIALVVGWAGVWGDAPDWQRATRATSATALLFFLLARYVNLRKIVQAVKAFEPWTTKP